MPRFLACLMFNSTHKHQSIVLLSHHFVMQSQSTEAIWSILKSSSTKGWGILFVVSNWGSEHCRSDSITFLFCWFRSMPLKCYQDKHLKFMYMLQSKGSYPEHIIGETSISHWEASVKANVASWFVMIMCHIQSHRNKKLSLLAQLQIHETSGWDLSSHQWQVLVLVQIV